MALTNLTRGSERTADFEGATYRKRTDFFFGTTLTASDQVLLWSSDRGGDGNFYQWGGAFPKVVPASATPSSSGGIGIGAWQSVGDARSAGSFVVVENVAALRLVPARPGLIVRTLGYYAAGDQGHGDYRYDSADGASVDNGGTVIVGLASARWKLIYQDKISVRQFGAKGDYTKASNTGTNDAAALQRAHDNIPRGVTVFYPLGLYYTASRIYWNGGSSVEFQSRATSTDEAKCAIVGALALDGVVESRIGDTTFSTKVVNAVITRQTGNTTSTVRGLICSGVDQQVFVDVASYHHGIAVHVNGQLAPVFERLNTWDVNGYHIKISTCVEPRFLNCRLGRNGGADRSSDAYVLIDGAGGISVDTVDFTACQFNQSGQLSNSVIRFVNYNNPNGIVTFTGCHMEGWGVYVVNLDGTVVRLQRVKFVGCTGTSDTRQQFIGGNGSVLEDLQITGCTLAVTMTFDQVVSASLNSSHLDGPLIVNQGKTIICNNRIVGNITLQGGTGDKLTFMGNQMDGTLTDGFTGLRAVMGNI